MNFFALASYAFLTINISESTTGLSVLLTRIISDSKKESAEKLQQEFDDPHDLIINDELTQLLSVHSVGPLLDTYEITIA